MIRDEIQTVAQGMSTSYTGIFSFPELVVMIDSFFKKKGYTKHVINHKEEVSKAGRQVSLRLRPFKPVKSNKLEVQLWLDIRDMTDVKKKIDGIEVTLNKGRVSAVVDAFVLQDIRGKWDARPEYVFIKTIFDKMLFSSPGKDFAGMVKSDAVELKNEIHSFLNMNKFIT
ncbi:TPA: hypothetical protein HA239_02120 [Candidatus Woesearchaeota archaeon]|nr:hypothetical protein QT06_C0001G1027 [archaeon GW2011_AR15]MBS3104500.1 hypothetical protein [Candidatus Woesearchaeota archaeon]HIH41186.1 hypothetical protein [Candidatus Woesearchaeota archaeon]